VPLSAISLREFLQAGRIAQALGLDERGKALVGRERQRLDKAEAHHSPENSHEDLLCGWQNRRCELFFVISQQLQEACVERRIVG
jgi:hypothetical protein